MFYLQYFPSHVSIVGTNGIFKTREKARKAAEKTINDETVYAMITEVSEDRIVEIVELKGGKSCGF